MPNWCIGTLRVRGKKDNIINFIKQQFVLQNHENKPGPSSITETALSENCFSDDEIELPSGTTRISGLHRVFIKDEYLCVRTLEGTDLSVIAVDCKAAWAFEAKELQKLSQEFGLDFRIYSFEMGAEFNQDIEIISGEIKKDECVEFKNLVYEWDCIMPKLGG